MKRSIPFILLAAFVAIGISSCSKEKNNDDPNTSIIGTWKLKSINFNGKVNNLPFNHDINADAENYGTFTFNANGTYSSVILINIDPDEDIDEPEYDNGTYSISNKKLITTSSYADNEGQTIEYDFDIKGQTLKLKAPEDTRGPVPGYDIKITMTLNK